MLHKSYFVHVIGVFFLLGLSVPSTSTISPGNEEENESWTKFLSELERYSGLDEQVPYRSVKVACTDKEIECIINPNGTIVWDVREQLYDEYLTKNKEDDDKNKTNITLDGCLNKTNITDYTTCMTEVRTRMTDWLQKNFDNNFAKELQKDCSTLVHTNCVN